MSLLRKWFNRLSPSGGQRTPVHRSPVCRPQVELLEARQLLSTLSAISWHSGGVSHHSVYAIGGDNGVYVSTDGGAFTALGGYALGISAGLDASGNPEVYAIGGDNSLFVNNGGGFVGLGGYVKQISGSVNNLVYAIGVDDSVQVNNGGGFVGLGGYALDISAGLDASGNPEVYVIGWDHSLFVNNGGGFVGLGGHVLEISAPSFGPAFSGDLCYAVGSDHGGYLFQAGFNPLGGYIL